MTKNPPQTHWIIKNRLVWLKIFRIHNSESSNDSYSAYAWGRLSGLFWPRVTALRRDKVNVKYMVSGTMFVLPSTESLFSVVLASGIWFSVIFAGGIWLGYGWFCVVWILIIITPISHRRNAQEIRQHLQCQRQQWMVIVYYIFTICQGEYCPCTLVVVVF